MPGPGQSSVEGGWPGFLDKLTLDLTSDRHPREGPDSPLADTRSPGPDKTGTMLALFVRKRWKVPAGAVFPPHHRAPGPGQPTPPQALLLPAFGPFAQHFSGLTHIRGPAWGNVATLRGVFYAPIVLFIQVFSLRSAGFAPAAMICPVLWFPVFVPGSAPCSCATLIDRLRYRRSLRSSTQPPVITGRRTLSRCKAKDYEKLPGEYCGVGTRRPAPPEPVLVADHRRKRAPTHSNRTSAGDAARPQGAANPSPDHRPL